VAAPRKPLRDSSGMDQRLHEGLGVSRNLLTASGVRAKKALTAAEMITCPGDGPQEGASADGPDHRGRHRGCRRGDHGARGVALPLTPAVTMYANARRGPRSPCQGADDGLPGVELAVSAHPSEPPPGSTCRGRWYGARAVATEWRMTVGGHESDGTSPPSGREGRAGPVVAAIFGRYSRSIGSSEAVGG
jgi:hypothetical protein